MNFRSGIIPALIMVLMAVGCKPNRDRESLLQRVRDANEQLLQDTVMRPDHAIDVVGAIDDFVARYPRDSVNPRLYFKAALIHQSMREYDQALACTDSILIIYPENELAPHALHFQAYYIYEEGLKDLEKAQAAYQKFLKQYPEHELVPAVLFSLENLGRTPEDYLNEWKRKGLLESDSLFKKDSSI